MYLCVCVSTVSLCCMWVYVHRIGLLNMCIVYVYYRMARLSRRCPRQMHGGAHVPLRVCVHYCAFMLNRRRCLLYVFIEYIRVVYMIILYQFFPASIHCVCVSICVYVYMLHVCGLECVYCAIWLYVHMFICVCVFVCLYGTFTFFFFLDVFLGQ